LVKWIEKPGLVLLLLDYVLSRMGAVTWGWALILRSLVVFWKNELKMPYGTFKNSFENSNGKSK